MKAKDPREGKPSASSIERIMLCPGSMTMEAKYPQLDSQDGASGTRIHDALHHGDCSDLTASECSVAAQCRQIEGEVAAALMFTESVVTREKRLWSLPSRKFSGQFDTLYLDADRALIIDYKTGHKGATRAARNPQMMALAVLVSQHHPSVQVIACAVIQPRCRPVHSLTEYRAADLAAAKRELHQILEAASRPNAPRMTGPKQCSWCRARGVCPEANATALAVAETPADSLTTDQLTQVARKVSLIRKICKDVEDRVRNGILASCDIGGDGRPDLTTQQEIFSGVSLKSSGVSCTVDASALWANCRGKISPDAFLAACKVSLVKLAETAKTLGLDVDELTQGCMVEKPRAPQLRIEEDE